MNSDEVAVVVIGVSMILFSAMYIWDALDDKE